MERERVREREIERGRERERQWKKYDETMLELLRFGSKSIAAFVLLTEGFLFPDFSVLALPICFCIYTG